MIQVVTQTANHKSKALDFPEELPPLSRCENGKHHLRHVERVTPIVISNVSVVLLDAQQPPTEHLVVDVEALDQIQIEEHSQTSFKSAIIIQIQVVKCEVVQLKVR